ncbi:RHS domain-containing protein [Achromobacter spanius]|uniref:RHS domain-containing protein n=1 Tax=Achromobacter spanius TaxID=217203 RepID=UPI001F0BAA34|nr:RHS domain-containing protein [Achromobacter spanius]
MGTYDIDRDPLWTTSPEPDLLDALVWYQCDHLGTPQELTDAQGEIVWSAQYRLRDGSKKSDQAAHCSKGLATRSGSRGSITIQRLGYITTGIGTMVRR